MNNENAKKIQLTDNSSGHTETIDLSKVNPMFDPGCQHEYVREAEPSAIPGTHTEICKHCPRGRIVRDF